ncbi:MAG: translation initiation factor IF-2 [Planctomycetaceae bacterium]
MAIRIYTLAKELKLDSKELVELCTKAGIQDKGSALASLTDEEVAKLREFMAGRSKPATGPVRPAVRPPAAGAPRSAPLRREDYIAPAGTAGGPVALDVPAVPPAPQPTPPTPGIAAESSPAADSKGRPPAPPEAGPAGRPSEPVQPRQRPSKLAPRPAFRLAPMPVARPQIERKSDEPAPQKPEVKLPIEAIRSAKTGGAKPLAEHMRKHEQRQTQAKARGAGPVARGPGATPPPPPLELGGRPRRTPGKAGTASDDLLGGREVRQLARKRTVERRVRIGDDDDVGGRRRRPKQRRGTSVSTAAPRKANASIQVPCNVRAFSEAIGLPASEVLKKLLGFGMSQMPSMSTMLDSETVELLASELGVELDIKTAEDLEKELLAGFEAADEDPGLRVPRPPVVTFLGHVDHGKTSLLDKILGIDVAARESGGITQHMRAYSVQRKDRSITFVDTPGHEAFTQMRARGANVTDCAVIVVAADDGIMPQTEEAISHAKAAGVPIVACINKIDLPGANVDRIYQQLAANDLLPTEWGGEIEVVKTSALTGEGVDSLLDVLLTIADLHELQANPDRDAAGVCLDASIHEGRGVVACLLVQKGTLRVGDAIVCGEGSGFVKSMSDTLSKRVLKEAGPARPVFVSGLDSPPVPGERFYVVDDIARAREVAVQRSGIRRHANLATGPVHVTLENLHDRLGATKAPTLNLILRADVRGSIEAIQKELGKLDHPEVKIRVLQAAVGGISEADVALADASDAVIIGFNVVPDERARAAAEAQGVQVRRYDVIYQVTDDLRNSLEGMLSPERRESDLGRAVVQRTFAISRIGVVAGCRVIGGIIARNGRLRVIRDNRVIGDYGIESLKREKDDAKEVRDGLECGIKLAGFNDVKEGDVLECYRIEEVARTLS